MSNFLSRWSLRKRQVQQGEQVSDEKLPETVPENGMVDSTVEPSAEHQLELETEKLDSVEQEKEKPTERDIDAITGTSNVSQFMARGVDKKLKKAALRKMFLNPEFAMEDEPNYSTPPKLDSETASKLREWIVEPEEEQEEAVDSESFTEVNQPETQCLNSADENDNEYQYVSGELSETKKTM